MGLEVQHKTAQTFTGLNIVKRQLVAVSLPMTLSEDVTGCSLSYFVCRTIAPTLGGAMFSWSVKMSSVVGAPLDVSLTFVFFGFVLFISGLQCVFLPDHLDHQKK